MYDALQTALTYAIEAIAFITIIGLPGHCIIMSHVKEVQSWGTPHATPVPGPQLEVKPELAIESPQFQKQEETETVEELFQQAEQIISKPIYEEVEPEVVQPVLVAETVEEVVKPRKTSSKTKPQPMSVGAAAIDYSTMTSEQLRKECALQGVAWRNGGDYGKPMKKGQMLAALR